MKEIRLSHSEVIEEIEALEAMISQMEVSMARGADWLISQMGPDGPIANEPKVSYNHKVSWGLYEAGRTEAVLCILDWLVREARRGPGEYYFPHELPFEKDMQRIYRFLTFGKIAEYLHYDGIANDAERERACQYQHESGGCFNCIDDGPGETLEPLNTSFFGQWALAAGMVDKAKRAADWLVELVDLNEGYLNQDPARFYYNRRVKDGKLVTEFPENVEMNYLINTRKVAQPSWATGTTIALLADVYTATGQEKYLAAAITLADYEKQCDPKQLIWPSKCKVAWGMAELYRITGDPEHRKLCASVNRTTFIEAQGESGGWSAMYYPIREDGVWRDLVYTKTGHNVPESLPDDGSYLRLCGQEVTGEFMGEMGCSLAAFQDRLAKLRCQKAE